MGTNGNILVTLIIATCGRSDLLIRTLESLVNQDMPVNAWELILVDNHPSNPQTRRAAELYRDKLPMVLLEEPKPGKNFALNLAVDKARGELVVFSDDDVIATRDWLSSLWRAALRHKEIDIFGGRILPEWPSGKPLEKFDLTHVLIQVAFALSDKGIEEVPVSGYDVWGPNMAVRSRVFKAGHRYDTSVGPNGTSNYIMGSETEFTTRMESLGFRCLYVPQAVVRHQIRTEQMSDAWIRRRIAQIGWGESRRWPFPDARRLFGIPLFCFRSIVHGSVKWFRGKLTGNPAHRAEGLTLWLSIGRASQYRRDWLASRERN
jgi:glycosyltransferase involved in cell wall biosynthesis